MEQPIASTTNTAVPARMPVWLSRSITLMKPITWFAPMWAFLCGAIASGATGWSFADAGRISLGIIMAGPILCGVSQVINDYFDREVDAINEPHRLIPSGKVSIPHVMFTILTLLIIGIIIAMYLGVGVLILTSVGVILGVFYSAPPIRAKRNGWAGNAMVAVSYEGLAWLAGHMAFAPLTGGSILVAALYSLGAHGIMSINDYKSIDGDRISGINTIPVMYGTKRAAKMIVATMDIAQLGIVLAFLAWGQWIAAAAIVAIFLVQVPIQRSFLQNPEENFLKFSAIGVSFFVWGMMAAAVGLRAL